MRVLLQGVDGTDALFDVGGRGVVVNTRTLRASVVPLESAAMSRFWLAPHPADPVGTWAEVASQTTAPAAGDVSVVASGAETRAYTVPKGVARESARGLESATSVTQVARKVASMLATSPQVELPAIRHLARYFARAEKGNPSWSLWGGDPSARWVASTLGKLEARGVIASADVEVNLISFYEGEDDERSFYGEQTPDGQEILSLFRKTDQNTWMTWFNGDWEPGDEPSNGRIVELDDDTAVYVAGALYDAPDAAVKLVDLDPEEWDIIQKGLSGVDWEAVDRVVSPITAAAIHEFGPLPDVTPGVYTPDERSKNAGKQPRDATGRFAQVGDTGTMPSGTRATIETVNPVDGTVIVRAEDGNTYSIPSGDFTVDNQPVNPTDGSPTPPAPALPPLNLDAILGQPRATSTTPKAFLKSVLPPMGPAQLKQVIDDYGQFILDERMRRLKDFEGGTGWQESGPAYNSPILEWSRKLREQNKSLRAAGNSGLPLDGENDAETQDDGTRLTPDNTDVPPLYLAIVDHDDPRAVMDLVAMIPAGAGTNDPTTFRRVGGEWVEDPKVLQDMRSPTPPPVVQLDATTYQDVLGQVDSAPAEPAPGEAPTPATPAPVAASVSFEPRVIPIWGPNAELLQLSLLAAGGADRNRGDAERLRTYWLHGEGAAKIRWGTGGDWRRCVRQLSKYLGPRAKGYCALRHKEATGMWTGDKAHRQLYGLIPNLRHRDSTDDLLTSRRVIRASADAARLRVARARVFGFNPGDEPTLDPEHPEQITGAREGRAFTIPLLIPEGLESGDGRTFDVGALGMRTLPLPLMWQIKTGEGHDGAVLVGRIDRVSRVDGGLGDATGVFDSGPYGQEAQRLVEQQMLRWVSADLDRFEAQETQLADDGKADDGSITQRKMRITKGRLMGATLVAKPAFQECTISLDPIGEVTTIKDGIYVESPSEIDAQAIVAAGTTATRIPVEPPSTWFEDPQLSNVTPLTVTNDGRVFGHIAPWDIDHIGMPFGTRAPRSASNYAYFHTGVVQTDEGRDVQVGQLTLAGGHASLEADAAAAVRHYDDTASAIADVHAGEDRYGIWVAGALRPGTSPEQIRALRASAPSGDWRPINGRLELVAVCQVNVPGFPVARARVASGAVMALVAAGAATLARMKGDPVQELQARIQNLEAFETQRTGQRAQAALATLDAARRERDERAAELSAIAAAARTRVYAVLDVDGYMTEFKDFSDEKRQKLAGEKKALKDGSFPIENASDLRRAIKAYGRADEAKQASVRRHIVRRARALGKADLIPQGWSENAINDLALSARDAKETLTAAALAHRAEQIRGRIS